MTTVSTCENIYCIYWQNDECILKEIELGSRGNCNDCVYVKADAEYIEAQRQKILSNK